MLTEKQKEYYKIYRLKNKDKINLRTKNWKLNHHEIEKERNKKYREQNRLKIRERSKLWERKHRVHHPRVLKTPEEIKQRISLYSKKWRDKNYFGGLKQEVYERDNFECQECGMNNEQHIVVFGNSLVIHHIDRNRDNNVLDNLKTLCRRCHIIVHKVNRWGK